MLTLRVLAVSAGFLLVGATACACGGASPGESGWGNGEPGSDPSSGKSADGDQADPGVVRAGDSTTPPPADQGGASSDGDDAASTHATIACTSPNACSAARDLGVVLGDSSTGVNVLRVQGTTSEWLKVRVQEGQHAVNALPMRVRATLFSPTGTNFDLTLFVNEDSDAQACTAPVSTSTSALSDDVVSAAWGEDGRFANSDDDSRWVTLQVKQVSGPCAPDVAWHIVIEGGLI